MANRPVCRTGVRGSVCLIGETAGFCSMLELSGSSPKSNTRSLRLGSIIRFGRLSDLRFDITSYRLHKGITFPEIVAEINLLSCARLMNLSFITDATGSFFSDLIPTHFLMQCARSLGMSTGNVIFSPVRAGRLPHHISYISTPSA